MSDDRRPTRRDGAPEGASDAASLLANTETGDVLTPGGRPSGAGGTSEIDARYVGAEGIGAGGMGEVLAAFDQHLEREVAVKVLRPRLAGDAVMRARFLREARITARLQHPAIVPVYELGTRADGSVYYTMKRIVGRTLADAIDDTKDVKGWFAHLGHYLALCHAVAYAHSRGVIHRDIKPANVMVGEHGETQLLDWGLAKVRGEPEPAVAEDPGGSLSSETPETLPGTVLGTPRYMSPEQADGNNSMR